MSLERGGKGERVFPILSIFFFLFFLKKMGNPFNPFRLSISSHSAKKWKGVKGLS